MKKLIALIIFLLALLCAAAEEPEYILIGEISLPDKDAVASYAQEVFYGTDNLLRAKSAYVWGYDKTAYDDILPHLKAIAAGEEKLAVFKVLKTVLEEENWAFTAEEWSAGRAITLLKTRYGFNWENTVNALVADLPYDLYWAMGESAKLYLSKYSDGRIAGIYIGFVVDETYRSSEKYKADISADGLFSVDPGETEEKKAAFALVDLAHETSLSIVAAAEDKNDAEKLLYYADTICRLNTYNYDAARDDWAGSLEPWKITWVFDGDPDTNVVCEGYAEAFKFLCDQSTFDDPLLEALCVTGTCGGNHMWNVVTTWDGSYLVDVTNMDLDDDDMEMYTGLFMVRPTAVENGGMYASWVGYTYYYRITAQRMFPTDILNVTSAMREMDSFPYTPDLMVARRKFKAPFDGVYTFDCGDSLISTVYTMSGEASGSSFALEKNGELVFDLTVSGTAPQLSLSVKPDSSLNTCRLNAAGGLTLGADALKNTAFEIITINGGKVTLDASAISGSSVRAIVFADDAADCEISSGTLPSSLWIIGNTQAARAFAEGCGLSCVGLSE